MFESITNKSTKVAILRDRLYVSGAFCTEQMLEAYQVQHYLGKDPLTKDDIYETLSHYEQVQISQDETLFAFNRGDLDKMYQIFSDFKILDERLEVPMRSPLKIKFSEGRTWRKYQPAGIQSMLEHEGGILQAPARSGKTLMIAATVCALRQKTIIFAHQTDLLLQLYDTFEDFTNLSEIRTAQNPIVGFPETWEDFETLDVVLCTKQTFDSMINRQMARVIQKLFGAVFVDEVHFLGADIYSSLINRFWARYRMGVTATPHRKDGLDIVVDGVMGSIIHKISPEEVGQVRMEVTIVPTGAKVNSKGFTYILNELADHTQRNDFILSWMKKDTEAGHYIIAVTDRKQHGIDLVQRLQGMGIPADAFNGNKSDRNYRKKILNRLRSGESKVLITMRGMTTGLDIPRADCFYNLMPSANVVKDRKEFEGEGGYWQQCTRVLTPFEGKKVALVRDFADDFKAAYLCLKERKKTYMKLNARIFQASGIETLAKVDFGSNDSTTF